MNTQKTKHMTRCPEGSLYSRAVIAYKLNKLYGKVKVWAYLTTLRTKVKIKGLMPKGPLFNIVRTTPWYLWYTVPQQYHMQKMASGLGKIVLKGVFGICDDKSYKSKTLLEILNEASKAKAPKQNWDKFCKVWGLTKAAEQAKAAKSTKNVKGKTKKK